jgi:hypothetical protein
MVVIYAITAPLALRGIHRTSSEGPGDATLIPGTRVMFFAPDSVLENGLYSEWITARPEDFWLIPERLDNATAGGAPIAHLTAQITHMQAGHPLLVLRETARCCAHSGVVEKAKVTLTL